MAGLTNIRELFIVFLRDIAFCIRCGQGGADNFDAGDDRDGFLHYKCRRCGRESIVSHQAVKEGHI